MKKLVASLALLLALVFATDALAASVRGYTRKDGTYVRPHTRTAPDGNPYNNYSFPGNYNPNTGKITPGNPDTYLQRYYEGRGGTTGDTSPLDAPASNLAPKPASPALNLQPGHSFTPGQVQQAPAGGPSSDPAYHRLLSEEFERQLNAERNRAATLEQQLNDERQRVQRLEQQLEAERQRAEREVERKLDAEYQAWQAEVRAQQEKVRAEAFRKEAEGQRLRQQPIGRAQSGAQATLPERR